MLRFWVALFIAVGLFAQDPNRALRPQQDQVPVDPINQEDRVALVIGNSAYAQAPLKNPVNDARAMKSALGKCGFKVTLIENASKKAMEDSIRAFGDQLHGGTTGLFYYAGHGIQVKGVNYLIPVEAVLAREDEVPYQGVDAGLVLDKMDVAKNRLNIIILDACRNDPFARSWRSAGEKGGLAQVNAPTGSLIAYATSPGKTAADGKGENGQYTEALLIELQQPGVRLLDLFQNVRKRVKEATRDAQVPWESNSTVGDFLFTTPTGPGTQTVAADPASLDKAYWESVRDSKEAKDFEFYLAKFPRGLFVDLAKQRLAALLQASPKPDELREQLALVLNQRGDCQDCGLEEVLREALEAKGWVISKGIPQILKLDVELEITTMATDDEMMKKWPMIRAVLRPTYQQSTKASPLRDASFEVKGIGSTITKARLIFRKNLREKLDQVLLSRQAWQLRLSASAAK